MFDTYIVTIIGGVMALVVMILAVIALVGALRADKKAGRNSQRISKLEQQLAQKEQELAALREAIENVARSKSKPAEQPVAAPSILRTVAMAAAETAAQVTPQGRLLQFIQEYNDLMSQRDNSMAARDAKKAFVQKYQLRGFDCINFEARMNHPELPPQFAENANPAQASFWAMQAQGETYGVVPNLKAYEEQVHQTAGMKEVFDSNFQGGSYSGIKVLKPAFFAGLTQLMERGKLDLKK